MYWRSQSKKRYHKSVERETKSEINSFTKEAAIIYRAINLLEIRLGQKLR